MDMSFTANISHFCAHQLPLSSIFPNLSLPAKDSTNIVAEVLQVLLNSTGLSLTFPPLTGRANWDFFLFVCFPLPSSGIVGLLLLAKKNIVA